MLYYNVHAASLCNPLNANTHAHKTAGTYTTIFLQRHPGSARKKNKSQSSSAFIAPRSCIFFAPGRWSVAASAASTDQTAAGII